MPLFTVTSNVPIQTIPHAASWRLIEERLLPEDRNCIETALDKIFANSEIETAGWMPGSVWEGTPWMPIYVKAARKNASFSGLLFGLMVFEHAMRRPEKWIVGKFSKDGEEIRSLTYFRAAE